MADGDFWHTAGSEFRLACQSRCVDCEGIEAFKEQWGRTAEVYAIDPTIPNDVSLVEAQESLERIVEFLSRDKLFPLTFDLPESG